MVRYVRPHGAFEYRLLVGPPKNVPFFPWVRTGSGEQYFKMVRGKCLGQKLSETIKPLIYGRFFISFRGRKKKENNNNK